ncbi:MAG: T9SS type A sorting domain-containing protein [Candidatus Zixiibacteriota bacterium]|nr:MAG: T9SS type A sorting domain-containing protein [candidate division Zixibacteria bacterium]
MKKLVTTSLYLGGLLLLLGMNTAAQEIHPTPYFTSFADTNEASTFNGQPLVVGSIIKAFDQSETYCGVDTVVRQGTFGYFSVYGDDGNTDLDEGAIANEDIIFTINGRTAEVIGGDGSWNHQTLKSVTLQASGDIDILGISWPGPSGVPPGATVPFAVEVQNKGDGLDFYGVSLSMSAPSGSGPFDWEALEPDTIVYAEAEEVVPVGFAVRVPIFNYYVTDTIFFTVYSHLDPTVSFSGSFTITMDSPTDADEPNSLLPAGFALNQNYPNPFNPTTTITFSLPGRTNARLEIINLLGRTVDDLDLGVLGEGDHRIDLDAAGLASGVYFYRLITDYASDAKKMILLK